DRPTLLKPSAACHSPRVSIPDRIRTCNLRLRRPTSGDDGSAGLVWLSVWRARLGTLPNLLYFTAFSALYQGFCAILCQIPHSKRASRTEREACLSLIVIHAAFFFRVRFFLGSSFGSSLAGGW